MYGTVFTDSFCTSIKRLVTTVVVAGLLSACNEYGTAEPTPTPATPTLAPAVKVRTFKDCEDCPEMVFIPAGSFMMGSPTREPEEETTVEMPFSSSYQRSYQKAMSAFAKIARGDFLWNTDVEHPQHEVHIPDFAIGKYEVTQGEWKAIMGKNPSHFKDCGDSCPVENINRREIREFISKLNSKTGKTYRLPSEAEWEYAARAGTATFFHTGDIISTMEANFHDWGNYLNGTSNGAYRGTATRAGSFRETTTSVDSFDANAFGLHDIHGNVWEWVQDCWHDSYDGAPADGSAWLDDCTPSEDGKKIGVIRGGSWLNDLPLLRSAFRGQGDLVKRNNAIGLRLAMTQ